MTPVLSSSFLSFTPAMMVDLFRVLGPEKVGDRSNTTHCKEGPKSKEISVSFSFGLFGRVDKTDFVLPHLRGMTLPDLKWVLNVILDPRGKTCVQGSPSTLFQRENHRRQTFTLLRLTTYNLHSVERPFSKTNKRFLND